MSETFDFLFGEYRELAARLLEGTVVEETTVPLNYKLMDAPYVFNSSVVEGLREYFALKDLQVKRIVVFNTLITNLQRSGDMKMVSRSSLYVVKNASGELNAVYFSGCALGESAQDVPGPPS